MSVTLGLHFREFPIICQWESIVTFLISNQDALADAWHKLRRLKIDLDFDLVLQVQILNWPFWGHQGQISFDALWRDGHDAAHFFSVHRHGKRLYAKNIFVKRSFSFGASGSLGAFLEPGASVIDLRSNLVVNATGTCHGLNYCFLFALARIVLKISPFLRKGRYVGMRGQRKPENVKWPEAVQKFWLLGGLYALHRVFFNNIPLFHYDVNHNAWVSHASILFPHSTCHV